MPSCLFPQPLRLTEEQYEKRMTHWLISGRRNGHPQPLHHIWVRCGKCDNCLRQRRMEWSYRLFVHLRYQSYPSYFLTLTYNDENLPEYGVSPLDVQLFLKRLRHYTDSSISYFLTSEYGSKTSRAHYHAIIFNYKGDPADFEKAWNKGNIFVGSVTSASIGYVAKYFVQKQDHPESKAENFARMSKGIGKDFLETTGLKKYYRQNGVLCDGCVRISAPRYFKDKLVDNSFQLPFHELGPGLSVTDKIANMTKEEYAAYCKTNDLKLKNSKKRINNTL